MKIEHIKIGGIYQLKNNHNYFKAIKILKPKEQENTKNYIIIKGQFSQTKDFTFGVCKYFRAIDLIKCENSI